MEIIEIRESLSLLSNKFDEMATKIKNYEELNELEIDHNNLHHQKNGLILLVCIEKIRLDVNDSNHFLLRNNSKIKVFLLLITKMYSIYLKTLQNH